MKIRRIVFAALLANFGLDLATSPLTAQEAKKVALADFISC